MSQSPLSQTKDVNDDYLESFAKLAQRIRSGNSFSGNERNCAFMNSGDGTFTDASYSLDLDLIDDSRGMAVMDLDRDGDPDYLLTNRTAPRLRVLRNDINAENNWLVIKLIGDPKKGCPRDAIGARVEVNVNGRKIFRTLYAGDSFLSQSSKSLRFGLGKSTKVNGIKVKWPSGHEEVFDVGLEAGEFIIRQGTGKVESSKAPAFLKEWVSSSPVIVKSSDELRIRLSQPLKLPKELEFVDLEGNKRFIDELTKNGPVLVNLWASWCAPCIDELRDFAEKTSKFKKEGLELLALSVDNLYEGISVSPDEIVKKVKSVGYQGRLGFANDDLIAALDSLIRESIYRHTEIPIPTSLLIDRDSWLTVIYKGKVSVDQIISDKSKMGLGPNVARKEASPFEGLWAQKDFVRNPIAVSNFYLESGYLEEAKEHLISFLSNHKVIPGSDTGTRKSAQLAQVHYKLAEILSLSGDNASALSQFKAACHLKPNDQRMLLRKVYSLAEAGESEKAEIEAKVLCEKFPSSINHLTLLGDVYTVNGNEQKAVEVYNQIIRKNPKTIPALRGLSWLHSRAETPNIRDGVKAVKLAEFLMKSPGAKNNPDFNMIIGSAYKELGDENKSINYINKSYELALDQFALDVIRTLKKNFPDMIPKEKEES